MILFTDSILIKSKLDTQLHIVSYPKRRIFTFYYFFWREERVIFPSSWIFGLMNGRCMLISDWFTERRGVFAIYLLAGFRLSLLLKNHSFSTYIKFLEKLTFLTSWYTYVRVRIMGVRNNSLLGNFAYILNEWPLT